MRPEIQNRMILNYRLLMEEVKNRIAVLNILLAGKTGLPNPALQEMGFLQLRMLCELVALACLTAHGEIPEAKAKSLQDEWNATAILKRLERLHADFYPTPIAVKDEGPGRKHITPKNTDSLTKAELPILYGRCADLLHRGSIARLLKLDRPHWPTDTAEIIKWGQKLSNLLSEHWIGHLGGETHLLCLLESEQGVNVAFLAGMPDEQPVQTPSHQGPVLLPGLHPSKPWTMKKK
jgi:hypothetical protein